MAVDRMVGDELRARREVLGITTEALAERLAVRHDTVRAWERGKDPVPYGVGPALSQVEDETAKHVEDLVQIIGQDLPPGWEPAVVDRAQPAIRAWGWRWWRHVVVRAWGQAGGRFPAALLVQPARWEATAAARG